MQWYSQLAQDRWIATQALPGKRGGYFVEVGAFDGVADSNTYALEKSLGWRGICVEANPVAFHRLSEVRTCTCRNLCLWDHETEIDFLQVHGEEAWHAELSGVTDHLSASLPSGCSMATLRMVTSTLEAVLEECQAPSVIDYLSLDTEGSEYAILRNFPFSRYRFRAITIEHNRNPELRQAQRKLLRRHGYVLVKCDLIEDFWLHRSTPGVLRTYLRQKLRELLNLGPRLVRALRDRVQLRTRWRRLLRKGG